MSEAGRGGARVGAGRKTKGDQPMRTRAMRWTDEGWADVLLIGMDRVRALVAAEAAKVRKASGSAPKT